MNVLFDLFRQKEKGPRRMSPYLASGSAIGLADSQQELLILRMLYLAGMRVSSPKNSLLYLYDASYRKSRSPCECRNLLLGG
jgi:hypothetical protein